ncbi:hypothetical protein PIB30_063164 [Stylosanthes scabra]|uniref:Uncharacterized protein n=1 Tax=Stylosanthes scabra TaxID=79078 RepID=A0ABU6XMY1_9FABA|nr:hypothetical protein [Stylosanthes scabra]
MPPSAANSTWYPDSAPIFSTDPVTLYSTPTPPLTSTSAAPSPSVHTSGIEVQLPPTTTNTHPMITRFKAGTYKPKALAATDPHLDLTQHPPKNVTQAFQTHTVSCNEGRRAPDNTIRKYKAKLDLCVCLQELDRTRH